MYLWHRPPIYCGLNRKGKDRALPSLQQKYWQFYWPLALTGIAMVLAAQFQNGTLARYPDAARELATFAIAASTYSLFDAMLGFVPQTSNVFARSAHGSRIALTFLVGFVCLQLIPLSLLAYSGLGELALVAVFNMDPELLHNVRQYLRFFMPILMVSAIRHFFIGKLIQAQLTGWVTILNICFLATVILMLVIGIEMQWVTSFSLPFALLTGTSVHLVLVLMVHRSKYRNPVREEHAELTYREVMSFFLPVTFTSLMFSMSRPVLYAYMSRMPDSLTSIAAMRVAFDLSGIFGNAANTFRHFFVTFGLRNVPEMRVFMVRIALLIMAALFLVAVSPVGVFVFGQLLGVEGEVLRKAPQVLVTLTLLPAVMITRNYYHGLLMVHRQTTSMAIGGALRLASIFALASLLESFDLLTHITSAAILVAGFATETVFVLFGARNLSRHETNDEGTEQNV